MLLTGTNAACVDTVFLQWESAASVVWRQMAAGQKAILLPVIKVDTHLAKTLPVVSAELIYRSWPCISRLWGLFLAIFGGLYKPYMAVTLLEHKGLNLSCSAVGVARRSDHVCIRIGVVVLWLLT